MSSSAREAILSRVRSALLQVPADEPQRWEGPGPPGAPDAYREHLLRGERAPAELFAARVADYRAQVVRCACEAEAIAQAVAVACERHDARLMLVPNGLPESWLAPRVAWRREEHDRPLATPEIDAVDGVLSAAALAIAETGTIVLDHGPGQGRRLLTLLPDLHVCVVRATQIVGTVPEGLRRLRRGVLAGRPLTLISGPSATSDIELERVEGVHGPRRLVVLVVE